MNSIGFTQKNTISPIQVNPGGRYFVDRNGSPAFWLGDTQWELFRLFTADKALRILRDRQSKGFNVSLVMLTGVDTGQADPGWSTPYVNLEGETAWVDGDPLQPNENYFQHIDSLIRLGEQTGQTLVVGVFHQWHVKTITLDKARSWARWVARRYRSVPNLIWSMYPRATDDYALVCRELAAGLQEGDEGAHLICMHPDPSVASSSFMHTEKWLAFNMIQTCIGYDKIYEAVTADYQRTPVKPVVMAEGGYEGEEYGKLQTPHAIRKQAYWTQLAGGYHIYGHNDCWKAPLEWERWIDSPGSRQLQVFKEIITSCHRWWELIPDSTLITAGAGSGYALNAAARSAAGDWVLAYLSEPSSISLQLVAALASSQAKITWINPLDGARIPAGNLSVHVGSLTTKGQITTTPYSIPALENMSFTTPQGWEDALLLVEAV